MIPNDNPESVAEAIGAVLETEALRLGASFKPEMKQNGINCSYTIYIERQNRTFSLHLNWIRSTDVGLTNGTIGNGSMTPSWDLELLHGNPNAEPLGWEPSEAVPSPPFRWGMYPSKGWTQYLSVPPTEILTETVLIRELACMKNCLRLQASQATLSTHLVCSQDAPRPHRTYIHLKSAVKPLPTPRQDSTPSKTQVLIVGRTPWSAADALVGLLIKMRSPEERVQGDPRGPGGPPHEYT